MSGAERGRGGAGQPGRVVIALGTNVHIFAPPSRRKQLAWCFETALGCGPVRTVQHPAMAESMLLVDFPGGGHLSIGHPYYVMAPGGQVFTIAPMH